MGSHFHWLFFKLSSFCYHLTVKTDTRPNKQHFASLSPASLSKLWTIENVLFLFSKESNSFLCLAWLCIPYLCKIRFMHLLDIFVPG